jgi:hypothetical protein
VEKQRFVPQLVARRWETIERFIRVRPFLFDTNGSVVSEWRCRNGRRFGPYYRLKYREGKIQRSIYLGPSDDLAEKVRRLLQNLQFHRTCRRLSKKIRASLRIEKIRLQNILRANGYYLKGSEIHKAKSPT